MVMWLNCMRFVTEEGIAAREVERLARTRTNWDLSCKKVASRALGCISSCSRENEMEIPATIQMTPRYTTPK
jgi:hypothetical protein